MTIEAKIRFDNDVDPSARGSFIEVIDQNACEHEPDLSTIAVEVAHGGDVYVDVLCKRCHRSGCIGLITISATSWD